MISNAYETFKFFYDVIFNKKFRNLEINRIQWHKCFILYKYSKVKLKTYNNNFFLNMGLCPKGQGFFRTYYILNFL
jgi:hypothetical protein